MGLHNISGLTSTLDSLGLQSNQGEKVGHPFLFYFYYNSSCLQAFLHKTQKEENPSEGVVATRSYRATKKINGKRRQKARQKNKESEAQEELRKLDFRKKIRRKNARQKTESSTKGATEGSVKAKDKADEWQTDGEEENKMEMEMC